MADTKVSFVYRHAEEKTLTCSQVMELLMNQPTSNELSHAQLHTTDGFRRDPTKITVNVLGMPLQQLQAEKEKEWAYDSHLFPSGSSPLSGYQPGNYASLDLQTRSSRVMLDQGRIAQSNQYNERTGLGEIPAVAAQFADRYYVKKLAPGGKGKPADIDIASPGAVAALVAAEYVRNPDSSVKVFQGRGAEIAPALPRVPAKSTHTMFEDSESMVMHLTAALLSDAGKAVMKTLKERGHDGGKTVGIFSKTAVLAVAQKFKEVAKSKNAGYVAAQTTDRKAETDPLNQRNLTGAFSTSTKAIDHVVVVLACSQKNDLIVITCFPSPTSTLGSINTATLPGEDIAEHVFGAHTKMPKQILLPKLNW